jgi:hypothetical protein
VVRVEYPPLLILSCEAAYKAHFLEKYCRGPVETFDGIRVWFRADKFDHDFFESSRRDGVKDLFSMARAQRMSWIESTLKDPLAVLKQGWLKKEQSYDPIRRVAIVKGNYIVVIGINVRSPRKANFITAYLADTPRTLSQITSAPAWK